MVGPARLDVSEVPTGKLNPSTVTVVVVLGRGKNVNDDD